MRKFSLHLTHDLIIPRAGGKEACMPQIMRLLSEGKDRGTTVTEREREKNTCGINVRGRLIQFALVVGEMCALYPRG